MKNIALLAAAAAAAGPGVKYLFRDLFLTDRAAGAVNATPVEPGPGNRATTDTESKISIASSNLVFSGGKATPGTSDPFITFPAFARTVGTYAMWILNFSGGTGQARVCVDDAPAWSGKVGVYVSGGSLGTFNSNVNGLDMLTFSANTDLLSAFVFRSVGAFVIFRATPGVFKLGYVHDAGSAATVTPKVITYDRPLTLKSIKAGILPVPWNTDYGIATQRLAGPRAAGDTFTHEADCLVEWTVASIQSAGSISVSFREQDVNNKWRVVISTDGSLTLYEQVGGVDTNRGTSAAGSIANGQRMVVIADGSLIKIIANNVLKITYASAANFATATAGKLLGLGTGGAVSDIVSWPRVLSGAALATLNRM